MVVNCKTVSGFYRRPSRKHTSPEAVPRPGCGGRNRPGLGPDSRGIDHAAVKAVELMWKEMVMPAVMVRKMAILLPSLIHQQILEMIST